LGAIRQPDATASVRVHGSGDRLAKKRDALQSTLDAKQSYVASTEKLNVDAAAQQVKVEGAKTGLNAAVLKLAEAQNRLAKVDKSTDDPKGEDISKTLIDAQTDLNQVITSSEALQADIDAMKSEHGKLRATADQLKKAVAAAKAAASASDVYVEAVKSAQQAIANSGSDQEGDAKVDPENDFFKDAINQSEAAKKSAEAALNALVATQQRQTNVGEKLLKAEEQISNAKQAEANAYKKFTEADEAFKIHQSARKAELDKRDALIAQITSELEIAQEQLNAQREILQSETLVVQEFSIQQASATSKIADLQSDVDAALAAFNRSQATLRTQQRTRTIQSAAIIAQINADLRDQLRGAIAAADTTTSTARVIVPATTLFSKNSAQIRKSDAINLHDVAVAIRAAADSVPEGLDWIVRVDSYGIGSSDESWFLSQNRALAVAQSVIENGKFGLTQVSANGLINAEPLSESTADGWLEIVLTAR
jgi:hypothetical protein